MYLEVKDIKKSYGKKQVLRKVSFTAKPGSCVGIIGANGSGKSTLLRILAGVERSDGGSIQVDGSLVEKPIEQMMRYVGYIPQESVLIPELTVADNLELWASLGDYKKNKGNCQRLVEKFEINSFIRQKVKTLSGGMGKRVGIVCALLHDPSILLMDEPSAALDLVFKEELKSYIKDFTSKGGTVLLSSHDQGEIALCDALWAVKDGELLSVPGNMPLEQIVAKYIHSAAQGAASRRGQN